MGMFDDIKCNYPLPGTPPEFVKPGHAFHTKSLGCVMDQYEITEDGKLMAIGCAFGSIPPEHDKHTGTVEFYTSNIAGSGPGLYTRNGEDAESVEYKATFVDGQVRDIREIARTRKPALPASKMSCNRPRPTADEIAAFQAREQEQLTGRTMFLAYGGRDPATHGYEVQVVYDGKKEWVVESDEHGIENVRRFQRDNILFDTKEDAIASRNEEKADWQARKDEYDALVASRQTV